MLKLISLFAFALSSITIFAFADNNEAGNSRYTESELTGWLRTETELVDIKKTGIIGSWDSYTSKLEITPEQVSEVYRIKQANNATCTYMSVSEIEQTVFDHNLIGTDTIEVIAVQNNIQLIEGPTQDCSPADQATNGQQKTFKFSRIKKGRFQRFDSEKLIVYHRN